ncbi:aminoacyl-tRNA hydrolase [Limisalsivibrio acetivorans]|uniref:aminoacyl-tRNA hydrolase n=1 Tax=Limisalsivibrio acetivorans TaxID=1304888 RepID=UPI0003B77FDC|nr:aminoacyl-tRNA hydrolase [Limisalsivibrio acetivorans]
MLIVGLGNPGTKYAGTRHNLGFMVADELADRFGVSYGDGFKGLYGDFVLGGEKHWLLKPLTYMNLSGQSVGQLFRFYKMEPADVLVVQDDLDIPFGKIKLKRGGTSGGHNGIESIIQSIGSKDFPRLKMGIGKTERRGTVGHVLGKFTSEEPLDDFVKLGADACEEFLKSGIQAAMNSFNNKSVVEEEIDDSENKTS